jgi:hypothetical protein
MMFFFLNGRVLLARVLRHSEIDRQTLRATYADVRSKRIVISDGIKDFRLRQARCFCQDKPPALQAAASTLYQLTVAAQ